MIYFKDKTFCSNEDCALFDECSNSIQAGIREQETLKKVIPIGLNYPIP